MHWIHAPGRQRCRQCGLAGEATGVSLPLEICRQALNAHTCGSLKPPFALTFSPSFLSLALQPARIALQTGLQSVCCSALPCPSLVCMATEDEPFFPSPSCKKHLKARDAPSPLMDGMNCSAFAVAVTKTPCYERNLQNLLRLLWSLGLLYSCARVSE